MKTKITLTALAILMIAQFSSATVWRVNATPNADADFTTIQSAHNDASVIAGDTLSIEGSTYGVGSLSMTKQLTVIGNGFFLGENPETQHNISPSIIGTLTIQNGSQGSKFTGCTFNSTVYLYKGNIIFERNHFALGNGYGIYTYDNCSDILVLGNYFSTSTNYNSLYFNNVHSNILIANNYINGRVFTNSNFNGTFYNNIFNRNVTIYNSTLVNNIAHFTTFEMFNCSYSYNIGTSTQFGNQNGNQENVSINDLYVGASGNSTDGQWQLKVGSPAIGAGEDGADTGIFGGESPFVLSGMPPIPAIYAIDAQSLPSNTLDVTLKAKSHN